MKKLLNLVSILFLSIMAILPACKSSSQSKDDAIIIAHWMTDREKAFNELAEKYEQETGVKITFRLHAPSDAYAQFISIGAQTDGLPDIFGILGDTKSIASFINAGHVLNLDAALGSGPGSWKSTFYDEALKTNYFPPENEFNVPEGTYGIPIDVTTIPMIYNKKLFVKAGLDPKNPPATWNEFLDAGKKLRKVGVTGFVSGWAEQWLIYSLATNLAHNVMGAEKIMDTFRGKVPYTDADWVQVFSAFEDLYKAGFSDPGIVSLVNKYAEQSFASDRAGMTFNGSWAVNVYGEMNPELEYGVFRTPAISSAYPRTVWGAAGSVFNVNAKSVRKDKAVAFLKWLTATEQATFLLDKTKNLPAIKGLDDAGNPILKEFSFVMEDSIHPSRFTAAEEPRVVNVFGKGIQSIMIGEKTAEQVAKEIQAMKDKVSKS